MVIKAFRRFGRAEHSCHTLTGLVSNNHMVSLVKNVPLLQWLSLAFGTAEPTGWEMYDNLTYFLGWFGRCVMLVYAKLSKGLFKRV